MQTVHTLVLVGHVLISVFIVALVLLQRGKGAEAGTAFGAGASGTVFGARGSANFMSRMTAVFAALFFATSLSLAYLGAQQPVSTSIVEKSVTTESDTAIGDLTPTEIGEDGELPGLPEIDTDGGANLAEPMVEDRDQ